MTDFRKLLNIIQDNSSEGIEQYDCFDIELGEDLLIETGVLDVTEDSILLEADDKALELLSKHGVKLNEISKARQLFPNWNDPETKEFYDKPTFQRIKSGETEPVVTTDYDTSPKLRQPQRTSFKNYEDWRRYQIAQLKKATESMSEGQLVSGPWLGSGEEGVSVDELTNKFLKSSFNHSYFANDQKALDEITHDVRRFLLNLETTNKAFKLPSGKSIEDLVKSISHKVHNSLTSETNPDLNENRRKKSPFNNPDELARRAELKARDPNRSLLGKDGIYGNEYKQKDRYGDMYKIAGPKGELPENTDNDDLDEAKSGNTHEDYIKLLAKYGIKRVQHDNDSEFEFIDQESWLQGPLQKEFSKKERHAIAKSLGMRPQYSGSSCHFSKDNHLLWFDEKINPVTMQHDVALRTEKDRQMDEAKNQNRSVEEIEADLAAAWLEVFNVNIKTMQRALGKKATGTGTWKAARGAWDEVTGETAKRIDDLKAELKQAKQAKKNKKSELDEAKYRGRTVPLGKPFLTPDGPKKRAVYVKKPNGNVVKVNFGDKKMRIKKSNPKRRKSFRARHNCKNPGPRWKARYWSCRSW